MRSHPSGGDTLIKDRIFAFLVAVDELFLQLVDFVKQIPEIRKYWPETSRQINKHIYGTLPLALFIAFFVGIGSSLQWEKQATILMANQIVVHVLFEFGIINLFPFVLGLVLAGKIGSSVAAEIGSMNITEQMDALKTLSIRPVGYLGWPRVSASMIMLPLITIFSDVWAIITMGIASVYVFAWVSFDDFVAGMKLDFSLSSLLIQMVVKPAVFGFVISFIGYFCGSRARKGAKGVGQASIQAAVLSALIIIGLNYLIGELTR